MELLPYPESEQDAWIIGIMIAESIGFDTEEEHDLFVDNYVGRWKSDNGMY